MEQIFHFVCVTFEVDMIGWLIVGCSNIYNPFEVVEFTVHDNETGDFIGKSSVALEKISDSQAHDLELELQSREIQVS